MYYFFFVINHSLTIRLPFFSSFFVSFFLSFFLLNNTIMRPGADLSARTFGGRGVLELLQTVPRPCGDIQAWWQKMARVSRLELAADAGELGRVQYYLNAGDAVSAEMVAYARSPQVLQVLSAAAKPWSPANHALFPRQYRHAVLVFLLSVRRATACGRLAAVPPEVCWHVLAILPRQAFAT